MKGKFLPLLAAAALMMGVTSCNNDDDAINGGDPVAKGAPTTMQFVITAPKAPQTYATDANATADETALKTAHVLIYEQVSGGFQLEKIAELTLADFDPIAGSDAYELKDDKKISTTTGVKKIYVALNYPGTLPSVGSPISAVASIEAALTAVNDLSNATTGFAMFSTVATDATLVAEDHATYATANKKTVTVKRMVAKISVEESTTLRTSGEILSNGGKLTNLQVAVGNANKSAYALQNLVGASPNIVVQDKNWSSFAAGDFLGIASYALTSTAYQAVDVAGATIAAGTIHPMYAPENTAQSYDADGKNLTYVSIRAQYAPGFFCDATGTGKGANTTAKSFWTVSRTDGLLYYFDVEADADAFLLLYPTATKSAEYKDGLCYWRGYLNMDGAADASISGSKAAKFDVLRNVYYKAVINSIKAPGYPTDQTKVTEPTTLMMEVYVAPWKTHTDNWNI